MVTSNTTQYCKENNSLDDLREMFSPRDSRFAGAVDGFLQDRDILSTTNPREALNHYRFSSLKKNYF